MFRDIWRDEYNGENNDIKPYMFELDKETNTKIRKEIPISFNEDEKYKIFFHSKSRNGEAGRTVLYEFIPRYYC